MNPKDRLIIALDVHDGNLALGLVEKLSKDVKFFKVGLELFSSSGPEIVRAITKRRIRVFLDLKFHDIPNTVAKAASVITGLGVYMFNVHGLGGIAMMKKAADEAAKTAKALKVARPKILAVTILTSLDENELKKIGINDNMKNTVLALARLAKEAGLDGVVASPLEAKLIREAMGSDFLIVTPGIRPSWADQGDPSTGSGSVLSLSKDDQKRFQTPKEAIASGADYIVVGRPVTDAPDPASAVRKILEEIK